MGEYRLESFKGSLDENILDGIMMGFIGMSPNATRAWNELDVFGDTTEYLKKINATSDDEKALARLRENLIGYFENYEYIVLFRVDYRGRFYPWVFALDDGSGMGYIYLFSKTEYQEKIMAKLRENGTDIGDIVPVKINYDLLTGMLKEPRLKLHKLLLDPPVCNLFINGSSLLRVEHERKGLPLEEYMKPDPLSEIMKKYNEACGRSFLRNDKAESDKDELLARYLVNSKLIVPVGVAAGNRLYTTYNDEFRNAISCFSSRNEFHRHKTALLLLGRSWKDDITPFDACFDDIVDLMNDSKECYDGIIINSGCGDPVSFSKTEILKIAENKDKYLN